MAATRLDKLLAQSGERTRSEAARLIRTGRVTIDGAVQTNPACKADTDNAEVCLDGQRLKDTALSVLDAAQAGGYIDRRARP